MTEIKEFYKESFETANPENVQKFKKKNILKKVSLAIFFGAFCRSVSKNK